MSEKPTETPHEEKEIRCPRLGGPVNFGYCKIESHGKPCARTLSCWSPYFDVEKFLRETLSEEEFQTCFCSGPPTKLDTILEMIERARKIAEKSAEQDQSSDPENR